MKKLLLIFILTISYLSIINDVLSQEKSIEEDSLSKLNRPKFGILANYNIVNHVADFRQLPDVMYYNGRFSSGSGTGFTVGLFYELPFSKKKDFLSMILRLTYSSHGGELSVDDIGPQQIDSALVDNTVVTTTLNTKLATIRIEPLAKLKFYDEFSILAGYNVGYLLTKTFDRKEELKEPATGKFDNGSRERHQVSGDISGANSFQAALCLGLSYDLALDSRKIWSISPEILYSYNLTQNVEIIDWKTHSLRAGLSIKYSPLISEPTIEEIFKENHHIDSVTINSAIVFKKEYKPGLPIVSFDTITTKKQKIITENLIRHDTILIPMPPQIKQVPDVECHLLVFGVRPNLEVPGPSLRIEEFMSTNMQPLLNYVFFDNNNDELPSRYKRLSKDETNNFAIDSLFNRPTLETYYHLLNIIGKRLLEHPKAKITLTGCNSDVDEEKGNQGLSSRRAHAVLSYLTSVWKIDQNRITIKTRNLPEIPSNSSDPDGISENRRVEITSDTWDVIAPVIIKNNTLRQSWPKTIRLRNNCSPKNNIKEWKLTCRQDSKVLREWAGKSIIPDSVDWQIDDEKESIPNIEKPIDINLVGTDDNGKEFSSLDKINQVRIITVEEKKMNKAGNKKIDRYSLILFDFDKQTLNPANMRIIKFINSNLDKATKIEIEGFTDRMGDEQYNLELSKGRAKNTVSALNLPSKNVEIITNGFGESRLIKNNDFPEGRFYSRTVEITVEKEE